MEKDIAVACRIIEEGRYAYVLVKNGELVFTSRERGIAPMLEALEKFPDSFSGGSIADKVIGRATAFLAVYGGASAVHALTMSCPAREVFVAGNVKVSYDKLTGIIENRDRTGQCPMENLTMGIEDPAEAYRRLRAANGGLAPNSDRKV